MSTSSTFVNMKITDPIIAEAFNNALDAADNALKEDKVRANALVTDIDKIRKMMAKRKKKG